MKKSPNKKIEKDIINYSIWDLTKDILKLVKPHKVKFWTATLLRIVSSVIDLYPAFALATIVTFITTYEVGQSLTTIWTIFYFLIVTIIAKSFLAYYVSFLGFSVAERVNLDFTLKSVQHMFLLDMSWHERENSGNKIKRIQNAGSGFNRLLRIWFSDVINITVSSILIILILAQFDLAILLITITFLIIYFIIAGILRRKAGQASYEESIEGEKVSGILFESINNIRTVKVMSVAPSMLERVSESIEKLFNKVRIRIHRHNFRGNILLFLTGVVRIGILIFIFRGIISGHFELGFLILFDSYFSRISSSVDQLSSTTVEFTVARLNIARMSKILREPIKIEDNRGKLALQKDWSKISIKNLSFAYANNEILKNISFEINRGEKIGIIGLSGAGKSTLFKLLLKEREEFTGDILFDDISIKDIRKYDYFKQVSVVLQDTEVFNFSLKDNITITNDSESSNKHLLNHALSTAHIKSLVEKLPEGLDTLVGEKGVKLSGGERQRLGIARAVFKQPQLLLLDEATSHLDIESEEKIRESLHEFFGTVTAIVIAHRLTTIKEMDRILVIEDGKIIESGNFKELYGKNGRFYELWEKQKL
jgi:ABC-type multidrug transport system fused ATPase/permease subunit